MNLAAVRAGAPDTAPPWPVLQAPSHWRSIDFISDLHLQASQSATFGAWRDYMQATPADAVFILGDLFDVWVGDDCVESSHAGQDVAPDVAADFETRCAQVLQHAAKRCDIFFMHGNRDFLVGQGFAKYCGLTLLDDPAVLEFGGQRWLASHGDALCLDDIDYMQFRAQVRKPGWQRDFLAKPLTERRAIAADLRRQSETRKQSAVVYADIDEKAACAWLNQAQATALIHGHTHQPGDHPLGDGLRRHVLSDWDATASPARVQVLRLTLARAGQTQCSIERVPL